MFGPEEIIYRDNDFVDTLYIITKIIKDRRKIWASIIVIIYCDNNFLSIKK